MKFLSRSFDKILDKGIEKEKQQLYPYLYSVYFKGLKERAEKKLKIEPIKCEQCSAVLTNFNLIRDDLKVGTHFQCPYCGSINVISNQEIMESLPDHIDFIIEDIEKGEEKDESETQAKVKGTEDELYIAVIDISGSMSGAKLESVKQSLVQTIKDFKMNSPNTKFILITFESSVYLYLRHDRPSKRFTGDLLFAPDNMKKQLEDYFEKTSFLGSIGEFADGWIDKVKGLRSMDMTALGPALFFAINTIGYFQTDSSGRITLLTDGIANQGVGNLSGSSPGAQKFYENMAELCNRNGVIVDVVGVSRTGDNNEMGLETLGKLTDNTGGTLFLISNEELERTFSEMRQKQYLGRDVKVRFITPKFMEIKRVTGAQSAKRIKSSEINLGAVTGDRELYIELDSSKAGKELQEQKEIPIQLQVEYKDNKGRKRLRVINDTVKITTDEKEFKSGYNQKLNTMMNIQEAGADYYSGKAKKSKNRLKSLRDALQSEMASLSPEIRGNFDDSVDYIDEELEEIEAEESELKQKAAPQSSYRAVKGQMRSRISQELKELRMQRKKEQKK
jgi:Mg-chelatase subunit ChlD/DNA-directed RNA polymerase subunit RPC12/RpoP